MGILTTLIYLRVQVDKLKEKNEKPRLQFRKSTASKNSLPDSSLESADDFTFKIIQITDIHLGEQEDSDAGYEQDQKTWIMIDRVLEYESPDLIILSGDQVSANSCRSNATDYYQMLGEHLSRHNIPWAMTFGNHDDMDYQVPDSDETIPAKYSRQELLKVDQSFPLSLSQAGPEGLFGVTNYFLDISIGNENIPAARIFIFDSGGGSLPQAIEVDQIEWFWNQSTSSSSDLYKNIPAVAFQHIPTSDFYFNDFLCQGIQNEGIGHIQEDAGLAQALSDAGNVHFLAVGHGHTNDFCCPYSASMQICYGRKSGYGGYGDLERGSRVYELTISQQYDDDQQRISSFHWKSWVRLESGPIIHNVDHPVSVEAQQVGRREEGTPLATGRQ